MTWDERAYPTKCKAQAKKRNGGKVRTHTMTAEDDAAYHIYTSFTHGEVFGDVNMTAGKPVTVHMEMQWDDPEVAKDFSIIA